MIYNLNKHGPRFGPVQGNSSNRGSPPLVDSFPTGIPEAVCKILGTAVTPLIVIVKPPGRSFQALNMRTGKDLVCGHPALSHSGLPEQRPLLTDSSARCAIQCTTVEHIAKDDVKEGLCLDNTDNQLNTSTMRRAPSPFYATNIKEIEN